MSIQILDIYQGNKFDADFEKNTGTDAVLIKGGQGEYQDYFIAKCNHVDECVRVGLPWGIFWQMDARHSPEKHKAALKIFHDKRGFGQLGLWLACEKPFYPCPNLLYNRMPYAFYKPIESVWRGMIDYTGQTPGIYTSPAMWELIFGRCPIALEYEIASKSKLWAAQYGVKEPDKIGFWSSYWFWQYTSEPDYSVFAGDEAGFQNIYQPGQQPAPAEDPHADNSETRIQILDEAINAIEAIK